MSIGDQVLATYFEKHSNQYRPDIDGLRAVAVSLVVLFHAGLPAVGGGFIGVDIFFVISGYLIGSIINNKVKDGSFSFSEFYARRFKRIMPALLCVIFVSALFGLLILSPDEIKTLTSGSVAAIFGFSNILFWKKISYFAPDSRLNPMLMSWSLGIEEQFYLLFPALLIVLHRFQKIPRLIMLGALTVISFTLSVWMTYRSPPSAFFLIPARAWELGIGTLLAVVKSDYTPPRLTHLQANLVSLVGVIALVIGLLTIDEATFFPGYVALLPAMAAAAFIMAQGSFINRRVLSSPLFVKIGLISYSWYLWHWPLMAYVRLLRPDPPPLPQMLVVAAVSFGMAFLSWKFIERPFRSGRSDNGRVIASCGSVMLATAIALSLIYGAGGLTPHLYPAVSDASNVVKAGRGGPCLLNYGQVTMTPDTARRCVPDQGDVALIGDSHAAALASGLEQLLTQRGSDLLQMTKSSCPPLLDGTRLLPLHPGHAGECATFNRAVFEKLTHAPSVHTVIITGYWDAPFQPDAPGDDYVEPISAKDSPAWRHATLESLLLNTVRAYQQAGKRVIVLGDAPNFTFDPVLVNFATLVPLRGILAHWLEPDFVVQNGLVTSHLSKAGTNTTTQVADAALTAGATYRGIVTTLCQDNVCRFEKNHFPFFVDHQHLSAMGSQAVAEKLMPAIFSR